MALRVRFELTRRNAPPVISPATKCGRFKTGAVGHLATSAQLVKFELPLFKVTDHPSTNFEVIVFNDTNGRVAFTL